jgi:hypothetical protein
MHCLLKLLNLLVSLYPVLVFLSDYSLALLILVFVVGFVIYSFHFSDSLVLSKEFL